MIFKPSLMSCALLGIMLSVDSFASTAINQSAPSSNQSSISAGLLTALNRIEQGVSNIHDAVVANGKQSLTIWNQSVLSKAYTLYNPSSSQFLSDNGYNHLLEIGQFNLLSSNIANQYTALLNVAPNELEKTSDGKVLPTNSKQQWLPQLPQKPARNTQLTSTELADTSNIATIKALTNLNNASTRQNLSARIASQLLFHIQASRQVGQDNQSLIDSLNTAVMSPMHQQWAKQVDTANNTTLLRLLNNQLALNNYLQYMAYQQRQDTNTALATLLSEKLQSDVSAKEQSHFLRRIMTLLSKKSG